VRIKLNQRKLIIIAINFVFLIFLFLFSAFVSHQKASPTPLEVKIDQKNNIPLKKIESLEIPLILPKNYLLAGTKKGLYYWDFQNPPFLIKQKGKVKKILKTERGFYFLTYQGIFFTSNLRDFEEKNTGLTKKVIKHYRNNIKTFSEEIQDLKDLKIDPKNQNNLVTATKDGVFYSTNGGNSWEFLKNPTTTTGITSVLIYSNPHLEILFAHPFRGVYHKNISQNTPWKELNFGLKRSSGMYEEVSDLSLRVNAEGQLEILALHNFYPQILKLNTKIQKWEVLYETDKKFEVAQGLFIKENQALFTTNSKLVEYHLDTKNLNQVHIEGILENFKSQTNIDMQSLFLVKDSKIEYNLSSLWLLLDKKDNPYLKMASHKNGIYIQSHKARNKKQLTHIRDFMEKMNYNMVVIDMKDDFGNLCYQTENPLVLKYGKSPSPVHLKEFISYMKEKNIYLVARLVVFKDKSLYHYNNGQFAVKDKVQNTPWRGLVKNSEGVLKMNSEHWVDPYSEEVWEYNIEVAKDLIKQGFDEIQFDYIRFPTDGENLNQAHYPYQDKGMDKESALISFLSYARENIEAPLSVDIYGANGWHRTGARTGQDVELLQKYVDVICPMYYPSHFAQSFLDFPPAEKRPWRIYYYGSLRNYYMAQKNTIIRPYLQAFKMNRSYDNEHYGPKYIQGQVQGVEESLNMGYTFWNSASKYSILLESLNNEKENKEN